MTPNFALDLSEDGIVLLHRAPGGGGWFREGKVDFASDDIAEGLAKLRAKAIELEGEDFSTKMILPSSQLLFTSVSSGTDIPQALSERTPYRADQLSYATSGEGDDIKVIAVALETLGEAEGFISPHGLNPVGFTAIPSDDQFDGEPMLGGTLMGADGFDPDPTPVKIIEKPTFLPDPVAPVTEEQVKADPVPENSPEPEPSESSSSDATPEVEEDPPIEETTAAEDAASEEKEIPAAVAAADAEADAAAADALEDPAPAVSDAPPAAFSSRRQSSDPSDAEETGSRVNKLAARIAVPDSAPKLGGAPPKTTPPPAPKVTPVAKSKPAPRAVPVVPAPTSTRLKTIPPAAVAAELAKADPIAKLAAKERRGKPRFLGLILTAILLVCLGLAALLSSYVLPENAISRFLGGSPDTQVAQDEIEPALIEGPEADQSLEEEFDLANLPMDQTLPDLAGTLDADGVGESPAADLQRPEPITEAEAETAYAATGIWQHANTLSLGTVARETLDDLYIASLDPEPAFEDAPALIPQIAGGGEVEMVAFTPPPPPGVIFDIDERGLVVATPGGALNPNGVMVFQGRPPVLPGRRPEGQGTATPEAETPTNRLAEIRPQQRPDNLIETQERATLGGLSRPELASIRPIQRPASVQDRAEAIARALAEAEAATQAEAEAALIAATPQAVTRSLRAPQRPRNFDRVVAKARATPRRPAAQPETQTASASTASPSRGSGPAVARSSRAKPTGAVSATVARAATDNNAIALGKVALVGVFGTSSKRRALVRMPNGRFKKVAIGDRVDGGRVAAIDSNSLRYTKGGRSVILKMPKG